jgi:hypothetical protein
LNISSSTVIHPFIFAIFPVFFLFTFNLNQLSFQDIIFPLIVTLSITFLLWILLSFIIKNKIKSAIIISIGLILFFTYGHIHNIISDSDFIQSEIERHRYLLIPFIATFIVSLIYFVKSTRKFDNFTKIVNTISIVLIMISMANVGTFAFEQNSLNSLDVKNESQPILNNEFPNIYHIVLDGYAGNEVLNEFYNYQNNEFTTFLQTNDFIVPSKSTTNYAITFLSLTSILNMEYVNDFVKQLGPDSNNQHPVYEMTKNNQVMQILKDYGYKIIILGSTVEFATEFTESDVVLCSEKSLTNTEFIINLVKTSMLKPIYSMLFETSRDKITCSLDNLPNLHEEYESPIYVFSHILLPHPPFQFGPNGEEIDPTKIEISDDWNNKEGYINQVKFANKKISEFVTKIKADNNNSIILLHGDHGTGSVSDLDLSGDGIKQRMMIFNAYHLPGNPTIIPYDGISPVNSYRIIMNSYFEKDYPLLDDKSYFSTHNEPYDLIDVTSKLR